MKLIDSYLLREIVKPFVIITVLVTVIFASFSMARYMGGTIVKSLGLDTVIRLVGFETLIALEVLFPIAMYLSIVIGLGKLHSNLEIIALQASGINRLRIYRGVLLLAVPLCLLVAMLSIYARPWAYGYIYNTEARAETEFHIDQLQAGHFHGSSKTGRVIYAQNINPGQHQMSNVFLYHATPDRTEVIIAERAYKPELQPEEANSMQFRGGTAYQLDKQGNSDRVAYYKKLELKLKSYEPEVGYKRKLASTQSLWGTPHLDRLAELQWRLSQPLTTLLLALFAVPLSWSRLRSGVTARLIPAVGAYIVIYNLLGLARTWVEQGTVGTMPGIWWVHALLLILFVFVLERRNLINGCFGR